MRRSIEGQLCLHGALGYQFDSSIANNMAAFAGMLGVPMAIIAFSLILYGAARTAAQG